MFYLLKHIKTVIFQFVIFSGWWLSLTPLKNMTSSVGMMTFPTAWKVINLSNHQPVLVHLYIPMIFPLHSHGTIFGGEFWPQTLREPRLRRVCRMAAASETADW
jgi:hypothetical protein